MVDEFALFEDVIIDKLSDQRHEELFVLLRGLETKKIISHFQVNVPMANEDYPRIYQFFIHYPKDSYLTIFKAFSDSRLYFRVMVL